MSSNQLIPAVLTVVGKSEVKEDKNGRAYVTVTFKGDDEKYITLPNGKVRTVKMKSRTSAKNAYQESYLNEQPDFEWGLKVGDEVLGAIVTRETDEYDIATPDGEIRTVNSYSRVIMGDSTDPSFETVIKREFAAQGRIIVNQAQVQPAVIDEAPF